MRAPRRRAASAASQTTRIPPTPAAPRAPAPVLTPEMEAKVMKTIVQPTVDGMAAEGCPFTGVIFAGLMIEGDDVKLLEHNVRFGDPECQCLMVRMKSDLVELLSRAATGALDGSEKLEWSDDVAMNVVVAANGYPGSYAKGEVIEGLDDADALPWVKVFHAGTASNADGEIVSAGGRGARRRRRRGRHRRGGEARVRRRGRDRVAGRVRATGHRVARDRARREEEVSYAVL